MLIIDDIRGYFGGASIKDAGKKGFAIIKTEYGYSPKSDKPSGVGYDKLVEKSLRKF